MAATEPPPEPNLGSQVPLKDFDQQKAPEAAETFSVNAAQQKMVGGN